MKINVDRLCVLAGVQTPERSSVIKESAKYEGQHSMRVDAMEEDEAAAEIAEMYEDEDADPMEEMIEIDEVMLVQELRRAKKIMLESKRVEKRRKQNLLEAELKTIVETEVENVMKELNLNSSWVYGNRRPTRSKQGYTHQGSFLKGVGFK